jgi:glycosyltransferase involved in cell wall biosynthesis
MPDAFERPPIAKAPISVVLLAYNEGTSGDEAIKTWLGVLDALKRDYEILVVQDGGEAADGAKDHPRVRVLGHEQRRGLGAALRTGLAAAQHPLVCTCTCDHQYEPSDLHQLLKVIDEVDLVTGIRKWRSLPAWLRGLGAVNRIICRIAFGVSMEPRAVWLGWSGLGRRLAARWFFGVRVQDAECVLRLYRRSILPRLVIQSNGPFALVELLAKANFLSCLLAEAPVTHHPRAIGGITGRDLPPHAWGDAWKVLNSPDFGPPSLAIPPPPC